MNDDRRRDDPDAQWNKPRRPKAKKNLRDWCKGKEGTPHSWSFIVPANSYRPVCRTFSFVRGPNQGATWFCGHQWVCDSCGKQSHSRRGTDCPDRPADVPMSRW